jgi:predicted HTH transcriptional regulator
MTQREFFTAVIKAEINSEMTEFAENAIAKLDARNEKRSNTMNKTQIENVEVKKEILNILSATEYKVASQVATECEISTNKASALLRQLVADNLAIVTDVKVPKKGKVKGYALATVTMDSDE